MLDLHWTRADLDATPPADVAAIRWGLYAKALKPLVERDFEHTIRDLQRIDNPPSKQALKGERLRGIEELRGGQRAQATLREALELDPQPGEILDDLIDEDEEDAADG
jgi:hypothetical protein